LAEVNKLGQAEIDEKELYNKGCAPDQTDIKVCQPVKKFPLGNFEEGHRQTDCHADSHRSGCQQHCNLHGLDKKWAIGNKICKKPQSDTPCTRRRKTRSGFVFLLRIEI
jgi:hypothetical protein